MEWIVLIIGCILCIAGICLISHAHKRDEKIDLENQALEIRRKILQEKCKELEGSLERQAERFEFKNAQYNDLVYKLTKIQEEANHIKEIMYSAYLKYCDELENAYVLKEQNFDGQVDNLKRELQQKKIEIEEEYQIFENNLANSYDLIQSEVLKQIEEDKKELEKYKNTRAAALEANRREQEMEQKSDFYRVHLTETERSTIALIEELKPRLPEPRVLSMLVWQTFYQKKVKELCANVLGTKTVCGIYKITSLKTGMCYVGQATDCDARWKQHIKCGLGIDTPAGNKLYAAMAKEGVESFTFELLEETAAADLNEKERFYIDLYQAYDYGFNSTKGNK